MLARPHVIETVVKAFKVHPAVALTGPRQCGKTTLARELAGREPAAASFFDLEKAVDRRKLEAPEQALGGLQGLVVIDEIQRQPALFETLRVLLDRVGSATRFLLLGSASPDLIKGVSESLAGRVGLVDMGGFDLRETGTDTWQVLWQRGGFPRSFLAPDDEASAVWRDSFVRTFLERDLGQFGIRVPAATLRRFWTMVAHYHGQVWNGSEFARALGGSEPTARRYLDILVGAYMVRVLPPWHENLKKRQLRMPKIYVRDAGLLHALLDIGGRGDMLGHPKLGASWEGFGIEQILAVLDTRSAYYWGTHGGAELDLMVTVRGRRYGLEFKHCDAPHTTRSMRVAMADLALEHLWVVYPGNEKYALDTTITALPIREAQDLATALKSGLEGK